MKVDTQLMTRPEGVGITGHRNRYLTDRALETYPEDRLAQIERTG